MFTQCDSFNEQEICRKHFPEPFSLASIAFLLTLNQSLKRGWDVIGLDPTLGRGLPSYQSYAA